MIFVKVDGRFLLLLVCIVTLGPCKIKVLRRVTVKVASRAFIPSYSDVPVVASPNYTFTGWVTIL